MLFYIGLAMVFCSFVGLVYRMDRAYKHGVADRAQKRADNHFTKTEGFRRGIR